MPPELRPAHVPADATPTHNADGSTSWAWGGEDAGTYTENLPPCRPVRFVPGAAVPVPAPVPDARACALLIDDLASYVRVYANVTRAPADSEAQRVIDRARLTAEALRAGLTAEDHERIGQALGRMLYLKWDNSYKPPRVHTEWGSKTAQGLGATVARIVAAGGHL